MGLPKLLDELEQFSFLAPQESDHGTEPEELQIWTVLSDTSWDCWGCPVPGQELDFDDPCFQ